MTGFRPAVPAPSALQTRLCSAVRGGSLTAPVGMKTVQTRAFVLFIAAVAVALLLAGLVVQTGREQQRATDFVIQTHDIISGLGRSRAWFSRIIAAHRGYLLGGDRQFLDAIEVSERSLLDEQGRLESLISDNPVQSQRLRQWRELQTSIFTALAQQRRQYEADGTLPAVSLAHQDQARQWIALFEVIDGEEHRLLTERQQLEQRSRDHGQWLVAGLITLLMLLLGLALWRVRNDMRAQEQLLRLTARMERNSIDQERLRTVLEATPNAILMVDSNGVIVLVNGELERLFGYPRAELLGQPVEILLPERVRGHHRQFRDRFLNSPEMRPMGAGRDLFGRRRDGSEIPIEIGLSPLQTSEGMFVLAAVTDISVRKRSEAIIAQRAVEMATQRFDSTQAEALALFNGGASRQRILDGLLRLLAERHPFPVMLFYAYEEIGGLLRLAASHAAPPGVRTELRLGEGLVGAAAADRRLLMVDQLGDGHEMAISAGFADFRPVALLFCPVVYRDRLLGVLALAASDTVVEPERAFVERLCGQLAVALHNQQQYEDLQLLADQLRARGEEIEHKNVQLEVASRMKSEFLANMSHELRTPLNAIIGFAEVLGAGIVGEVAPQQREYLQEIHQAGRHLLALINDILDLSKVEAGRIELELEPFDAAQLGSSTLSVVREKALSQRVQLQARIADDLGTLWLDPRKVKQIVYNLLANAVKFCSEGGRVELSLRQVGAADIAALEPAPGRRFLLSPAQPAPRYLEIAVSDTGIGIEPDDLERLFEPFTQVDSSLARRNTGAGLGLAMVRRLTEKHEGRLMVESAPGRGSRFVVWLPWRTGIAERQAVPSHSNGLCVMLVDAEGEQRQALREQLAREGYEVLEAADAAQADELSRQAPPDAIVVPVSAPGFGGWGLLTDLKQRPGLIGTPVVIVSVGGELPHDFALGAADVLVKPVRPEDLHNALRRTGVGLRGQSVRALVVDDDPRAVTLMTTLLQGAGMEAVSAYGGREALTLVRSHVPDVIVLDLMMPDVNGLEVATELRRDAATADVPIIMVTAKWLSADERRQLSGVVDQVMQKAAFDHLSFIDEVRRVLQRRRGGRRFEDGE